MMIIDVRSQEEFDSGHVKGSKNIPLQEIEKNIEEIRRYEKPLILCCASGNRSGRAVAFLKEQGIDCENGGSWMDVQDLNLR